MQQNGGNRIWVKSAFFHPNSQRRHENLKINIDFANLDEKAIICLKFVRNPTIIKQQSMYHSNEHLKIAIKSNEGKVQSIAIVTQFFRCKYISGRFSLYDTPRASV